MCFQHLFPALTQCLTWTQERGLKIKDALLLCAAVLLNFQSQQLRCFSTAGKCHDLVSATLNGVTGDLVSTPVDLMREGV